MAHALAIENGTILPMTGDDGIIDDGHVLIEGDRIVAVGRGVRELQQRRGGKVARGAGTHDRHVIRAHLIVLQEEAG
jgi:imidazolonepropionase-like amidohydrolase